MTAGQFINLELLHKHYGASRVSQTAVRLRESGVFPKGQTDLVVEQVSIFLYCLFSTIGAVDTLKVHNTGFKVSGGIEFGSIIDVFSRLLGTDKEDKKFRDSVHEIYVSTRTGNARLILTGNKIVDFKKPDYNMTFDGIQIEEEELDFNTKVGSLFFKRLAPMIQTFLPEGYVAPEN